jgi:hypothetical protein
MTRALCAENRPPRQSTAEIATGSELIAKREEPATRQGGKLFTRKVVSAVRPHEVFALAYHFPGTECLAAY